MSSSTPPQPLLLRQPPRQPPPSAALTFNVTCGGNGGVGFDRIPCPHMANLALSPRWFQDAWVPGDGRCYLHHQPGSALAVAVAAHRLEKASQRLRREQEIFSILQHYCNREVQLQTEIKRLSTTRILSTKSGETGEGELGELGESGESGESGGNGEGGSSSLSSISPPPFNILISPRAADIPVAVAIPFSQPPPPLSPVISTAPALISTAPSLLVSTSKSNPTNPVHYPAYLCSYNPHHAPRCGKMVPGEGGLCIEHSRHFMGYTQTEILRHLTESRALLSEAYTQSPDIDRAKFFRTLVTEIDTAVR